MKDKKEAELVAEFKLLEKKLIETLKLEPIKFDESDGKTVVKKNIKNYIKKVEEAKAILNRYEEVAFKLNELASSDLSQNENVAKAVVGLRKKSKVKLDEGSNLSQNNLNDKDKNEVEVIMVDGKPTITKKKKKPFGVKEY